MRNPMLRVALAISAPLAVLLLAGAGMGIAVADPENPSETDTSDPPSVEPQPTTSTPTTVTAPTPEVPTLAGVLRDLLHRPFSIFGNGRVPGDPPKPVFTNPDGSTPAKDGAHDKPAAPDPTPGLEPAGSDPIEDVTPVRKSSSSFDVVLPFAQRVSVPFPSIPVPGYENLRLTIDLTDPYTAMSSVQETTNTINALLADAYAPYNPFQPPAPPPGPTFKILEEEPVVEAGGGNVSPVAESSVDLPVLQAPAMVPPVRVGLPRPAAGTAPAGATAQVLGAGTAGVRGPVVRGSVTQTGSMLEGQGPANGSASAMGRPALRQGYQQYLRTARADQVATIAVPGLGGLLAITASGVITGYRQANSHRYLRADAARFLQ